MLTLLFSWYVPQTGTEFARFLCLLALQAAVLLGLVWLPQQRNAQDGTLPAQLWRAAGRNLGTMVGMTLILFLCSAGAALVAAFFSRYDGYATVAQITEGIVLVCTVIGMITVLPDGHHYPTAPAAGIRQPLGPVSDDRRPTTAVPTGAKPRADGRYEN